MNVTFPSGTGQIVVTEDGGRIAELRPQPQGPNLLWRGDTVAPITGGDRLWLAPERQVFYPAGSTDRDAWHCPSELDPGAWSGARDDGLVSLRQVALGARMSRTVQPLSEPPVECDMPWAGYRVEDTVETDQRRSGWHLAMVPAPARLYVFGAADPLAMYGSPPSALDGWFDAPGTPPEWKVGLDPGPDGRVVLAALGPADPGPVVAIMTEIDPAGTYVDDPPDGGRTTAIQLYSSPGLGFCELEHHFPLETRTATARVIGAWGSEASRLELIERLTKENGRV